MDKEPSITFTGQEQIIGLAVALNIAAGSFVGIDKDPEAKPQGIIEEIIVSSMRKAIESCYEKVIVSNPEYAMPGAMNIFSEMIVRNLQSEMDSAVKEFASEESGKSRWEKRLEEIQKAREAKGGTQ